MTRSPLFDELSETVARLEEAAAERPDDLVLAQAVGLAGGLLGGIREGLGLDVPEVVEE